MYIIKLLFLQAVSGQRRLWKRWFFFLGKSQKLAKLPFFERTTQWLYMKAVWLLIDVYWSLLKPPHKKKLLSAPRPQSRDFCVCVFFLCRLQEQEQALNLSIKEATAKVSPVSSDHVWSRYMPAPLWKQNEWQMQRTSVWRGVPPLHWQQHFFPTSKLWRQLEPEVLFSLVLPVG